MYDIKWTLYWQNINEIVTISKVRLTKLPNSFAGHFQIVAHAIDYTFTQKRMRQMFINRDNVLTDNCHEVNILNIHNYTHINKQFILFNCVLNPINATLTLMQETCREVIADFLKAHLYNWRNT